MGEVQEGHHTSGNKTRTSKLMHKHSSAARYQACGINISIGPVQTVRLKLPGISNPLSRNEVTRSVYLDIYILMPNLHCFVYFPKN